MKKIIKSCVSLALAIVMTVGVLTPCASAASDSQSPDIADDVYRFAVNELADAGILLGTSSGQFGTGLTASRAMAVTVLGRMIKAEQIYSSAFSDVNRSAYYAGYAGWAAENNIITADDRNRFLPDTPVTGKQLDLMLERCAELIGIDYTAHNQSSEPLTRGEMANMVYAFYVNQRKSLTDEGYTVYADDYSYRSVVTWSTNKDAAILEGKGDANIYGEMYFPADFDKSKTYPIVIASHGFSVNHGYYSMMLAEAIVKAGYLVYTFDFCGGVPEDSAFYSMFGPGFSDGEWLDMSIKTEVDDLHAVIDCVKAKDFVNDNQVFLLGQSQGGIVSALTAAEREVGGKNDIAGAILLYPYLNVADDVRAKYPTKEDLPAQTALWLDTTVGARYFSDIYDMDVYKSISGYTGNVLIIQGLADGTVPYTAALKAVTDSYSEQAAAFLMIAGAMSEHSFEIFYPEGTDMTVSAIKESIANWLKEPTGQVVPQ